MAITRGPSVFGALYGAHQTSNPDLIECHLYILSPTFCPPHPHRCWALWSASLQN